jgi:hypothetical protein
MTRRKQVRLQHLEIQEVSEPVTVKPSEWPGFCKTPFRSRRFLLVKPTLTIDDGVDHETVNHQAVRVETRDWARFEDKLAADLAQFQADLDAEAPNRAQRRAKTRAKPRGR